jgi:hypothetical protein
VLLENIFVACHRVGAVRDFSLLTGNELPPRDRRQVEVISAATQEETKVEEGSLCRVNAAFFPGSTSGWATTRSDRASATCGLSPFSLNLVSRD